MPDEKGTEGAIPGVSGEWLRLLDLNPDALVIADRRGRVVLVNRAAERLFGEPRSALVDVEPDATGWRFVSASGTSLTRTASPFVEVARLGRAVRDIEVLLERRDGERLTLSCAIAPLSDTGGGESGVIASIRDVTPEKHEARRQHALALAGRLVGEARDVDEALAGIAQLIAPDHAEMCDVYFAESQHDIRLASHAGAGSGPGRHGEIPAAVRRAVEDCAPAHEEIDGTHILCVPLVVRSVAIGALALSVGRKPDADAVEFAERCAHCAALAVDNARLFRAAEEALAETARQHARSADILESISDAFWAVDSQDRFTYVNHRAETVLGRRREELIGRDRGSDLRRIVGVRIHDEMQRARVEAAPRVFEMEAPALGTWLEVHIDPGPDGVSVYLHDIGERKRAEDAQRMAGEVGSALAASLDYEETVRAAARTAVPVLGDFCAIDLIVSGDRIERAAVAATDEEAQAGLRRQSRRHPPDARLPSAFMRALQSGHAVRIEKIEPDRALDHVPDPELLLLAEELNARSVLFVPLTARGRRLGVITFGFTRSGRRYTRDAARITEDVARRIAIAIDNARLYEEAQESSRAKSNFISVMSHEFRTPLTAIVGYTDLLLAEVAGSLTDVQKSQLNRIKQSAWHLTQLIDEVLTFSRVDAGRETVNLQATNLVDVAARAAALIEPVAQEKSLRLVVDLPAGPLATTTDPGKVQQILINLLSNAVKFTNQGEVRLRARDAGNRYILEVEDTGVGISPQHLDRIFDSFWQAEQGPTRTAGGAGLGLTITRRLVQLLGGEIDVVSQQNRGTRFTVWFPVPEPSPSTDALSGIRFPGRGTTPA